MNLFKKNRILKFEKDKPQFLNLESSKVYIPKWYKEFPEYNGKNVWLDKSIKFCMPFLDSLTSGYMIPLPVDVYVEKVNGFPSFSWGDGNEKIIDIRPPNHAFVPFLPGFAQIKPAWNLPMAFKLPKGYSMLLTHPLNRFDLPFFTLSGIVDSYEMPTGNLPFMIKEDFTGLIKAGTPIAQIIPFKRENWRKQNAAGLCKKTELNKIKSRGTLRGWYKHVIWQKKTYE